MRTLVALATASVGSLALFSCTVAETKEPLPAGSEAPRVVAIGEMSVERAAHQSTLLDTGDILISGGCAGGCDRILSSTEIYDPAARTFRSVADMSVPRSSHAATSLPDGRVLIAGGWTGERATASGEIFDPASGTFSPVGEMVEPRVSPMAASLPDDRVLLAGGGSGALGLSPLASAEVFDPATSTFTAVGTMGTPRGSHAAVALADGRILITGGSSTREGAPLRSAEIFDPAIDTFEPTGEMLVPRHKHAAALLPDGRVLIIGGSDGRGYEGLLASTEIYDPATGEFTAGPDMHWPRHKLRDAVVVLTSGAILIAGGAERPELWDPADQVFVPVEGALSGPQMFATASLLPDGEVLVLGGYDDRIQSSASAWLILSSLRTPVE